MLIVCSTDIEAINFDFEKIDSIAIKSTDLYSTLSWVPVTKENFDKRSDDDYNYITKLSDKKDLILFTSILNNLQKEDFILTKDRIYKRIILKKLSDTIDIKKDLAKQSSIYSTKLVKIKNKYYLSYHPENDPIIDIKCRIIIYEAGNKTILWMSNFYIDMFESRYTVSKSLFESIDKFNDLFILNEKNNK